MMWNTISFAFLVMSLSLVDFNTDLGGYILTEGIGYHKIYTDAKNWTDARKACITDGAHLAIINSRAEETLLRNMLKRVADSIKNASSYNYLHIGIHDMFKEGDWVTVLGEPLAKSGYVHWSSNGDEPNGEVDASCGSIYRKDMGMHNGPCHYRFAYACEIPI